MAQKGRTKRRNILLLSATLSGLIAVISLLLALRQAVAKEPVHHVSPSCTNVPIPCYTTVQEAVDAARDGDVIKVAAGTYAGVNVRPRGDPSADGVVTQAVYITKTVTVQGGYTTTDWVNPNPDTNPTTLDAQGQGRVLYITGHASPTIEGLRITGGDAAGLVGFIDPGYGYAGDAGGGVYVFLAAATLRHNQVFSNTAGRGGGMFAASSAVTIDGNTVFSNSAEYTGGGVYLLESDKGLLERNTVFSNTAADGGGVFLGYSAATLVGNAISSNTAKYGGGVFLSYSAATLIDNAVLSNTASYGGGGGLYLYSSAATLSNNTVDANSATGRGGGLFLSDSNATLGKNVISSNTADNGGGLYSGGSGSRVTLKGNVVLNNHAHNSGGGLYLWGCDDVIDDNTIVANTAGGWGGGLYLDYSAAKVSTNIFFANTANSGGGLHLRHSNTTLDRNTISANTAFYGGGLDTWHGADTINGNTIMANSAQGGGGLRLKGSSAPTLTNNLIFENQADHTGGGLLAVNSSPRLVHTTIANNGGSGIHVTSDAPYSSTVALTNTILAGHEVGIVVTEGSTATLEATLWDNGVNWHGPGTVLTGTRNVWGDPGLIRRYRIGPNSAAINAGVDAGLTADIDGDPRPTGFVPDLGADERPGAHLQLHSTVEPYVSPGQAITYSLVAVSDGAHPVTHAALTNTLPVSQRVVAVTSSQGICTTTGSWGGEARCDLGVMPAGAMVHVTLTAQVTTTLPQKWPWSMHNATMLTAAQTPDLFAQANTIGHECRVRLNDSPIEYSTIQAAVDGSTHPTDVVKVAGGYCMDMNPRAGLRQMVYLSKTLTIQGGWNTSFTTRDVAQYTTTLDARGQGRVLVIAGSVSPTVEGLHITGGDAAGLDGTSQGGNGGGVYVTTATLTFRNNRVFSNTAQNGGGICLWRSDGVLSNNDITANSASYDGGGLYLDHSTASLSGSTITSNTATYRGGGLRLDHSDATLRGNTVSENASGSGGGVYLYKSSATFGGNSIRANVVQGAGGGLYIDGSEATLRGNAIAENTAVVGGGVGTFRSVVALEQNAITHNAAIGDRGWRGWGGGLNLQSSGVTLVGNVIGSNAAEQLGGGLHVTDSDMGASSNVIAGNHAGATGSGLYIAGSSTHLLHTTVAHNTGGDGSGVHVTGDWSGNSTVAMSNTILAKHTVGITVAQGNRATLEATLWGEGNWANGSDWGGAGMIETGTINLWDNPDFLDPASGDFRIGAASPAIDAGVVSTVSSDVDADPRPAGPGPDIGADEHPGASLHLHQDARPLISIPGQTVTYSLTATSAGAYTTTHTRLTDTLPLFQRAIDVTTDIGNCTASTTWGGSIACDLGALAPGQSAHITLIARVMTDPTVQVSQPAPNGIVVTARETRNTSHLRIVLHNCHVRLNDSPVEYPSIQAAVDASAYRTDIVKVAGYCPGVTSRAGTRQVVHLSKTLTIQGGWNISFTQRSVLSAPTTLDALGQGRVLYISGGDEPDTIIHATIEGLRITGGDASGLAGLESTWRYGEPIDGGGGVYASNAALTLRDSQVLNNTADCGGGLLLSGITATLDRNTVIRNVARGSDDQHNRGGGGGLYLFDSKSTLTNNTIAANTAPDGGGLYSRESDVALYGNTLEANTATQSGGGLYLTGGSARLARNTIARNVAYDGGGGASLHTSAILAGDVISGNTATQGGGLAVGSDATLNGTTIISNTADSGGGLYLSGDVLLVNNTVAENRARRAGSGVYISGSPRLLHTTIAHNTGGDGSGVYVTKRNQYADPSTVALTNTILAGHETGIVVSEGNTATLEATLWGKGVWANGIDWTGDGTVDTGTINVWDDPGFVDAAHGDYHINAQSPATDAGVASSALTDADGDPRPAGFGVDIGADERAGANLYLHQAIRPSILSPGQTVTYTVVVHSGGAHPATHVWLTDTLPARQQALSVTSTRGQCTANAGWGGQVVCDLGTLAPKDSAHITLIAWVTRTQPVVLPQHMQSIVEIAAAETRNTAHADTLLHDCHARLKDDPTPYYTVQAAVDASTLPTDVVRVAGTCMDVTDRYDTRQIVHLSKTLTIQGGWNSDFAHRNVLSTPTTLDARGLGRVFFITGDIQPTIEGLNISGGNTRELHRYATSWDYVYHDGGGVYVIDAAPTFRSNRVFGNVGGNGGGAYLVRTTATFDGNVVTDNVARGVGGGLSLLDSSASLNGNTIGANVAIWSGGGLHLELSHATLNDNTIHANTGIRGGGLYLCQTTLTSTNAIIADNQAEIEGSGLYVQGSSARLLHATIARNTGGDGSGVYVSEYYGNSHSAVWLTNTILVGHEVGIVVAQGGTVTLEDTLWGTGGWANGIDWIGDGTIDAGTVNVWGPPAFADPAQGDYHITAVSAAIDMGTAAGVAWDIDGEARPWAAAPDLGADEWTPPQR